MSLPQKLFDLLARVDPRILALVTRTARAVPWVRRRLDAEYDRMLAGIMDEFKPYRDALPVFEHLPAAGRDREVILSEIESMNRKEEAGWRQGHASGAVYHGDAAHITFLDRVYALTSQHNPLHADLWPSSTKFEAEIVAMTAHMLGAPADNRERPPDERICGTVTSGGTESILLAMKTYRDRARAERGVFRPNLVVPVTAHAAFDKAARLFRIKLRKIPVDEDFRADVRRARRAVDRNTVALVGSAPSFPHGIIDPIEELSEIASSRGVGFHTDACLGGFVLPWARRLGSRVPAFDFSLPGVTSVSADTHKYGYAAKGTSVVLYRGYPLRRHQYFTAADWPGGLYFSPTMAGSRPGALSAACWAAMLSMGEEGYLEATRRILETGARVRAGIEDIAGLRVLGDPLWVIAFASDELDIYRVMELMSKRGWSLNGLHKPSCVHLCITLRHTRPGVADRFLHDLRQAVAHVRRHPVERGTVAPVYGLAARVPFRTEVDQLLRRFVDKLYEP